MFVGDTETWISTDFEQDIGLSRIWAFAVTPKPLGDSTKLGMIISYRIT